MKDDFDKIPLGIPDHPDDTVDSLVQWSRGQWQQGGLQNAFGTVAAITKTSRAYKIPLSGKAKQLVERISEQIRARDEYKDALIFAGQRAVDFVTANPEDVKAWQDWYRYGTEDRVYRQDGKTFDGLEIQRRMLERLQERIVFYASGILANDPENAPLALTPTKVNLYQQPPGENTNAGYVNINPETGEREIYINTHPELQNNDLGNIINTLAHETAHIIEIQLANLYSRDPENSGGLGQLFQREAEAFYIMHKSQAYVQPDISFEAYREQLNEHVADMMGELVEDRLMERVVTGQTAPQRNIGPRKFEA